MQAPTLRNNSGGYVETQSGLIVPPRYSETSGPGRNNPGGNMESVLQAYGWSGFTTEGFNYGYRLDRDEKTMIIRWAPKGSGIDDVVNSAFADGEVANVGISPIPFPQLPGILQRQISQVASSSITVGGKDGLARRVRSAISRFNDSPVGYTHAIQEIVYRLRVYNRGAPIATVPITYPLDKWESEGLRAIPISEKGKASYYYLEVDWRGKTPVPFLPNPFDLEPTGNNLYPYWYRARGGKSEAWVLLHNSQIIPLLPGVSSKPGIGTCSTYMCLGFLGEHALVLDARHEKQVNAMTDGFLTISGVTQSSSQIRKQIEDQSQANKRKGTIINKGHTIITSPNEIVVAMSSFRRDDGVEFEMRRKWEEDVLALCFEEPLVSVVTRGGVGYGSQSNVASDLASDSGVTAVLLKVEMAIGAIYPRAQISVTRLTDRARRLNTGVLKEFSEAIKPLPPGVFTPEELRALIEQDILAIPKVGSKKATANQSSDEDDEESVDDGAVQADALLDQAKDLQMRISNV